MPTPWTEAEGNTAFSDSREVYADPAWSETLRMHPNILYGSREILSLVTVGTVVRVENSEEAKRR